MGKICAKKAEPLWIKNFFFEALKPKVIIKKTKKFRPLRGEGGYGHSGRATSGGTFFCGFPYLVILPEGFVLVVLHVVAI